MIQLGLAGKDKVTGFEGIITARAQYLTGCDQYSLQPPAKDGDVKAGQWFDEYRIEIIGEGIAIDSVRGPVNGGPQRDAPVLRFITNFKVVEPQKAFAELLARIRHATQRRTFA